MIFDSENAVIRIVGIEHMTWQGGLFDIKPRNYSALAFRISGNAVITANNKICRVGENDILYMPQNLGYRAEYTDTEISVIHFTALKNDFEPMIYSPSVRDNLYKRFLEAEAVWESRKPGYTLKSLSILYGILGAISESSADRELPEHFVKAVSLINSEFANGDITVSEICRRSGMSETLFRALFKKYYHKAPTEYITELRLERARLLISNGSTVKAAAFESGFNDSKYFARVVKSKTGYTPKELKSFGK